MVLVLLLLFNLCDPLRCNYCVLKCSKFSQPTCCGYHIIHSLEPSLSLVSAVCQLLWHIIKMLTAISDFRYFPAALLWLVTEAWCLGKARITFFIPTVLSTQLMLRDSLLLSAYFQEIPETFALDRDREAHPEGLHLPSLGLTQQSKSGPPKLAGSAHGSSNYFFVALE